VVASGVARVSEGEKVNLSHVGEKRLTQLVRITDSSRVLR
jgi:hypothetical protein